MAMKPLKTAHDMFYFVEDVMQILGYSKSKSYKASRASTASWRTRANAPVTGASSSGISMSATAWMS